MCNVYHYGDIGHSAACVICRLWRSGLWSCYVLPVLFSLCSFRVLSFGRRFSGPTFPLFRVTGRLRVNGNPVRLAGGLRAADSSVRRICWADQDFSLIFKIFLLFLCCFYVFNYAIFYSFRVYIFLYFRVPYFDQIVVPCECTILMVLLMCFRRIVYFCFRVHPGASNYSE